MNKNNKIMKFVNGYMNMIFSEEFTLCVLAWIGAYGFVRLTFFYGVRLPYSDEILAMLVSWRPIIYGVPFILYALCAILFLYKLVTHHNK